MQAISRHVFNKAKKCTVQYFIHTHKIAITRPNPFAVTWKTGFYHHIKNRDIVYNHLMTLTIDNIPKLRHIDGNKTASFEFLAD